MLSIDGVIHAAHLFFGDLSTECFQSLPNFGMFLGGGSPHQRHGVVRREIVLVVFEHDESQCVNQTVG